MTPKILIADTNDLLSESLMHLLRASGFEVVGATADSDEIISLVRVLEPDLLLIDYDMSNRIDIRSLRERFPKLKVLAAGLFEATDGFAKISKKLGLDGFFSKYAPQQHLLKSLNALLH